METVLEELQTTPCRPREVSENEKTTFSDCAFLQRYMPALDLFNVPDSTKNYTHIELPSKYVVKEWLAKDPEQDRVWNTKRTVLNDESCEEVRTFVKTIHLLNPIEVLKEKFVYPAHPLLPQNKLPWMTTQLKIHDPNNQAYVDTVANFVLSRFRELDLTPHCIYYYGAATGICNKYQYNISAEYDTYRQCKWFWRGIKSHGARLTLLKGDSESQDDDSNDEDFEQIYKEITTCPFDNTDTDTDTDTDVESITEVEVESDVVLDSSDLDKADLESVKSLDFDNIQEKDDTKSDVFELNKKAIKNILKPRSVHDSDSDSNSDESSCSDGSGSTFELDVDICLEIPNMPVVMIYQEAQDGVLDELLDEDEIDGHERGSQGWEARWIAWMFQVIAALTFLQSTINFTHNDLHSNNILWRETDKRFLYYRKKDGTTWRVPTFGKIFSIIDFGRSIFKIGEHMWISDDHWPDQDAGDQYNFGPFFDKDKPENLPNPSFDLCRLAISLIDGLWDEKPPKKKGKGVGIMSQEGSWKMYETNSPLFNLLWSWTINDAGQTVYEDKDGEEKYEGFDLYIHIAHDVHDSIPHEQLNKTIFNQFKWKQSVSSDERIYLLNV